MKNIPKREKQIRWEAEQEVAARERDRKAVLTMWARIDEADASDDVKEILHMMAEKAGLE